MVNTLDFIKIADGNLGAINFNNMIPLKDANYKFMDLDLVEDNRNAKYNHMLKLQIRWLNRNFYYIIGRAENLYSKYLDGKLDYKTRSRCCNFPLLEDKCKEYNKNIEITS